MRGPGTTPPFDIPPPPNYSKLWIKYEITVRGGTALTEVKQMTHETDMLHEILQTIRRMDKQIGFLHHESHQILEKVTIMQAEWDNLVDKVTKLTTVTASVKALLLDLITKVNAAPSIEAVRAVTAEISKNVDSLAEAVPANTPAA